MRHASGPLDWLRGPSAPRMMELVMRDFAGFMQQENMCFSGPGEANDHFDRYIDKANGISFMHDFPAGVALSESYPAVKAKYERRIERFLREVRSVNRVLLVYLTFTTQYRDEDLTESFRRLRQHYDNRPDILIIRHDEAYADRPAEEQQVAPGIILCRLHATAPGSGFMGNTKAIIPIFNRIRVKRKKRQQWKRRLREWGCNTLCLVLPRSDWRKRMRKKMNVLNHH